jgi:hypothetical protein
MQTIPDTGGGLSGFLGHHLWQVYVYFPSTGHLDWFLLILSLALMLNALFLPYLWGNVKTDMLRLRGKVESSSNQGIVASLWGLGWCSFLVWFFHTDAGKTFLEDRLFFSTPVSSHGAGLWWGLFIGLFVTVIFTITLEGRIDDYNKSISSQRSVPYLERGLVRLYAGGGAFVSNGKTEPVMGIFLLELIWFWAMHLFYWYWSVASCTAMLCFLLSAVVLEIFRMTFVYIHHSRAFG